MPFNKPHLAAMTVTSEEYIDKDEIAKRLNVVGRTVERLIERYKKRLTKNGRRSGRKNLYLWADILKYAKDYIGIEKENVPSGAIKKAYTKQRLKELEEENARLRQEVASLRSTEEDSFL